MKKKTTKKNTVKSAAKKITVSIQSGLDAITTNVMAYLNDEPTDLVSAIEKDHDGLRQFIDVLKDTKQDMKERRRAYELFSALLKSHSEAEEIAVYEAIENKSKLNLVLRIEEGYVEHQVASDVMARMEKAKDPKVWSAHANVLAELVEHHLDEEEKKMFPLVREQISKKVEAEAIMTYLQLRTKTQKKVTKKNAGVLEIMRNQ